MKDGNGDAALYAQIRAIEEKIDRMKEELETAQARITILTGEKRLLSSCVLELSESVFGKCSKKRSGLAILYAKSVMMGERCAEHAPPGLKDRVEALLREAAAADEKKKGGGNGV